MNEKHSHPEELAKHVNRGFKATQYFFLIIAIIVLLTVMYAVTGIVGAIITGIIVGGIVYAIRTGKMKIH